MISYFKVKGTSMEPACKEGDFVLLNKFSYLLSKPQTGDVVVLSNPEKRTILKYIVRVKNDGGNFFYWVEGLNKEKSSDSRNFGWIPRKSILGKAYIVRK